MTMMGEWSMHNKIDKKDFKTFDSIQGLFLDSVDKNIFHYCSLDTLWKILESNSFLATHVEFSNDTEEYNIGKKFMGGLHRKAIKSKNHEVGISKDYIDGWEESCSNVCFMVCFCQEDNILSQWREYAKNGVSIELDLNYLSLYEINKLSDESKGDRGYVVVNEPKKVIYIESADSKKDLKKCLKRFNKLQNKMESSLSLIPYIKHAGFSEEKEVRFVFEDINGRFKDKIDYLNRKGMKVPVLKVIPYQGEKNEVIIYTNFDLKTIFEKNNKNDSDIINKINYIKSKKDCDGYYPLAYLKNKINDETETKRKTKSIFITKNIENVEEQKQICDKLYSMLTACDLNDVDVQCEGYLPIKSITIGPSRQQVEIKRGVEEFLKQFYYWKNVRVNISDIPYRSEKSDLIG